NASCSFECENRVSTEKRQEMGEGRSESGQWRLLVINVPKRLLRVVAGLPSPQGRGGIPDVSQCAYLPADAPSFRCLSYQARMRFKRSKRCFSSWKPCGSRG